MPDSTSLLLSFPSSNFGNPTTWKNFSNLIAVKVVLVKNCCIMKKHPLILDKYQPGSALGILAVLLTLIKMVGLRQMAEPLLLAWSSKGISQTLWRISCFNRRPCDIFSMGLYPNIRLPRCKEQAFSTKLVSLAVFDQTHKSWFWRTGTDLPTVWGLPKHNNPHLQKTLHVTILQK